MSGVFYSAKGDGSTPSYSALMTEAEPVAIAGGGGGGGNNGGTDSCSGGGGGGGKGAGLSGNGQMLTRPFSGSNHNWVTGGGGGTLTDGGAGGLGCPDACGGAHTASASSGYSVVGQAAVAGTRYAGGKGGGGGGGGGYWGVGGGGSNYGQGSVGGGGGGGSGFVTSDASKAILESAEDGKTAPCVHKESGRSPANHRYGFHSCATSPSNCFKANGGAAPNSGDAAYVAGVAVGGTAAETEVGGNGLIVIEHHQGTRMFAYTGSLQTFSCPNPPADTATQFTDPLYQTPVVLNTTECEGRQGCACLPGFSGVDCEFSSGVAVCGNGVREVAKSATLL